LKVLIACEYSGTVRDAFIKKGHNAISCDLLPTDSPGPHYQGDVFDILDDSFDMMIAHPPCTHLAVSGAAWFKYKEKEQKEALEFVQRLLDAPIEKIALENPVSVISTRIRKPNQIIQPWQFGEPFSKKTCLWLKNLEPLKHTEIVDKGDVTTYASGRTMPTWYADAWKLPPAERAKLRSKTFQGIADAMADQWG
jgi:hypothetical protein